MENFQIENIDSTKYIYQDYSQKDTNLLNPIQINKEFGNSNDVVELLIISPNGDILEYNNNYTDYTNRNNIDNSELFDSIELNPEKDLLSYGYNNGQFDVLYNFNRLLFSSSFDNQFYIKEISKDRTEVKISSNSISFDVLQTLYVEYIINRNERNFYSDFILNFGDNKNIIGVNIALDNTGNNSSDLYIKLYEPLSSLYQLKDTMWLAEIISDPYSFKLNKDVIIESDSNPFPLRGPNFNIEINNEINTSTPYLNISNILDTPYSSSYNQLQSAIKDNIHINIDYNNYNDFIHFSSINERINNFIYKLTQIQKIEEDLLVIGNISSSVDANIIDKSIITLNNQLNNITKNFDGYESFLYYESGSNSFPKSNNTKPYINCNISDIVSLEWIGSSDELSNYYGGKLLESFTYDTTNRDYIWNNLPEYIKYDGQNSQLELIVSMMGQHFDYIWTYSKDITNKNINDNRLNNGISKDLVSEALKSFGIKLYTNSRNNENIYSSILGINSNGQYSYDTGSYKIDNLISSSLYTMPEDDILKETYKRLYHNLPYLLKSRGTNKGIRALINCFGISKTILDVKEFGGNIKDFNFIEQKNDKFNYSLYFDNSSSINIPFGPSNQEFINSGSNDVYPKGIELRFKLSEIIPTQSILESNDDNKMIRVIHTTGSYAIIDMGIKSGSIYSYSPPIELPLYNNDWWNININKIDNDYILNIGNKNQLGVNYYQSSSLNIIGNWNTNDLTIIGNDKIYPFIGEIQEFRYWLNPLPQIDFKNHILNPRSISYINEFGSYDNLIYRLSLGSELDNNLQPYLESIHPSSIPSFYISGSVESSSLFINYQLSEYKPNYEKYLINSPNIGNYVESNEKVKIFEYNTLSDNTLSPVVSILKKPLFEQTNNSSKLELGFSTVDSINNDITNQLGHFNIDEYIGDPKDSNKTNYPELVNLNKFYFSKYTEKQNIFELIKLLSYLDNSLFKMVKDFIPAKADHTSGLIVKPNILEKNKTQRFEPKVENKYSEASINTAFISGSNPLGTEFNSYNIQTIKSSLGDLYIDNNDNKELFNGELSGSNITAHKQYDNNIVFEDNKIHPTSGSVSYSKIILNPLLNNVNSSRKSKKYLNVDYSSNINTPTNIDYITSSFFNLVNNTILYSDIQESNYSLKRHQYPRYIGSKMISKEYNSYNTGDISFGKQPVIDKNVNKFAYFQEITSQSLTLPGRSNVYVKYLIDENANITELSKQNKNIFDLQSTFSNKYSDILLDDNQSPSKQKKLDGLNNIYAGGFRYEPSLQNVTLFTSLHNSLEVSYQNDIKTINNDNNNIISEIPYNSLILGNIEPVTLPTISHPLNTLTQNSLFADINTKLKIYVTRNTLFPNEIRQNISGTVKFKIYISPPLNLTAKVYQSNTGFVSGAFSVPQSLINVNTLSSINNFGWTPWDSIKRALIPIGTTAYFYNCNDTAITSTLVGTNSIVSIDSSTCKGVDYLRVVNNNTQVQLAFYNNYNDFGLLPSFNKTQTVYPVEDENGLFIEASFPINGLIVLPQGITEGEIEIQNVSGILGRIINRTQISNVGGGAVQFSTLPEFDSTQMTLPSLPYYYSSPPDYTYLTSSLDRGFNPGSLPIENWYFERGNSILDESGSYSNLLTGSYDLSLILFNITNDNNNITQISPILSPLGYEDIKEPFNLKIGDLVRLWDYDKDSFPINFENEIKNIVIPSNLPISGTYDNRVIIELKDEISNQSCLDYYESGSLSKKIQNFIFLNKVEDETNIVINTPKNEGKTSQGIILPDNITKTLKGKAGNIIKQLKNQNLI